MTLVQRFVSLLEVVLNRTFDLQDADDLALLNRVADAFVSVYYQPGEDDPAPEDLTNNQRAAVTINAVRRFMREVVTGVEANEAAQAAREAATADPPGLGDDD